MSKKREKREKARLKRLKKKPEPAKKTEEPKTPDKGLMDKLKQIYEKDYKKLMLITIIIFFLAILQIGWQTATTGDFLNKGVALEGGITITVPDVEYSAEELEDHLLSLFPENDITVRILTGIGGAKSLSVEADITEEQGIDRLESEISETLNVAPDDYTTSFIGSSLGSSFFRQVIIAVIVAFIAMAGVVFLYFRVPIPSLAVIVSALSDVVVTIAIVNLLGIKMSTGGIAALLMLIGYSVDTDILLTTRLFKRKEGSLEQRIYSSAKTGLTMTFTSIAAVIVAILLSQSADLSQIMLILLIGLIIDIPNTWIQNTGILKWYIEKKNTQ